MDISSVSVVAVPVASVIAPIIFLVIFWWNSRLALKSCIRYCETGEELSAWRIANPDFYVGDSNHARALVHDAVAACREFLRWHAYCARTIEEEIAFLMSLLDEHGPEPPRKPFPKTARPGGFF